VCQFLYNKFLIAVVLNIEAIIKRITLQLIKHKIKSYIHNMTTASTEYLGELRTSCSHNSSGTVIHTDAPLDNKGKGSAFSPTDLFVTSYAACMTTIIGIYCQEHHISIKNCSAQINKVMYSNPRRVGEIHIELDLRGNNWDDKTLQKVVRAGETCPVAFSINPEIKTKITYLTDSK
jgi:uncharacterized OsmC-like protein